MILFEVRGKHTLMLLALKLPLFIWHDLLPQFCYCYAWLGVWYAYSCRMVCGVCLCVSLWGLLVFSCTYFSCRKLWWFESNGMHTSSVLNCLCFQMNSVLLQNPRVYKHPSKVEFSYWFWTLTAKNIIVWLCCGLPGIHFHWCHSFLIYCCVHNAFVLSYYEIFLLVFSWWHLSGQAMQKDAVMSTDK